MLGPVVMGLRFACELAALGALAWWGAAASGTALAIALPIVAATYWGLLVAPRAPHRLRDPLRFAAESLVWAAAVAALVMLGRIGLGAGFGVVAIATAIGARRFEPGLVASPR